MAPIRVALIGLSQPAKVSWASDAHLPYLLSDRGRERHSLVALPNSSEAAARRAIQYYRLPATIKAYDTPAKLASDPNVDLVVCTTRIDIHYNTVRLSIEAGRAIFVEWPLAQNAKRAAEVNDLAKKSASPTIVGLQGRLASAVLKIRECLVQGARGKVLSSSVQAYTPLSARDSIAEGLAYILDEKVGGNPVTIAFGHMTDFVHSILIEYETSEALTQIQRPKRTIDNPMTGAEHLHITDVPDLVSVHGKWRGSDVVEAGASLVNALRVSRY